MIMTKGSAAVTFAHTIMEDGDGLIFGAASKVREDGKIRYIKILAMAWGRKEARVPKWCAMADHDGTGLLPAPARGEAGDRIKTQYVGFLPSSLAHAVVDRDIAEVGKLYEHVDRELTRRGIKDTDQDKVQDWLEWFRMAASRDASGNSRLEINVTDLEWGAQPRRDRKLQAALVGAFDYGANSPASRTSSERIPRTAEPTGGVSK